MGTLASMTGFGAAEGPLSERLSASVRLTSVNARFLEVSLRTSPRIETAELEPAIRAALAERLTRGRVQVLVELRAIGAATASFGFHWEAAEELVRELDARPKGIELAPLTLRDLLALPGFAEGFGEVAPGPEERGRLLELLAGARDMLVVDRVKEASALLPQIEEQAAVLEGFAGWLGEVNGQLRDTLVGRYRERLGTLLGGMSVPDERVLLEAAVLADRADVAEEVQRLSAHLAHLRDLLAGGGPVGKKLDFLLQELLREVNTAGSKCREAGAGERVVEAKAAIEKLREQIANLE